MCTQHVHMIVANDPADGSPLGTLSDTELLAALLDRANEEPTLGDVVRPGVETVSSEEPLVAAAARMRGTGSTHLLVGDPSTGAPIGVLSTLDVAGILAWGEA